MHYLRTASAALTNGGEIIGIVHWMCTGYVGQQRKNGHMHYSHRGPKGETVKHLGEEDKTKRGLYEWLDADTGELLQAQSRIGAKRVRAMPVCPERGCRGEGKPTYHADTYHLTITNGGSGPIDIRLSECRWSVPPHYIHFGPDGQVATPLPKVPGKKGRYELIVDGVRVETEWVASPETRKALGEASVTGRRGGETSRASPAKNQGRHAGRRRKR